MKNKYLFNSVVIVLVLIASFTVIFVASLLTSPSAHAKTGAFGLEEDNRLLEYTSAALIIADWGTTLDSIDRPDVYETNDLAGGRDATRGTVNRYFLIKGALHLLWNYSDSEFAKKTKNIFNVTQMYVTYTAVDGNMELGLEVKF